MVGFEFHVQIDTKYKMFSSKPQLCLTCSDQLSSYFEEPNTRVAYLDLALPGPLPVLNEDCLDQAIRCSLALKGQIPAQIKFDRKHYVYPDLP